MSDNSLQPYNDQNENSLSRALVDIEDNAFTLKKAVEAKEPVSSLYFLFEHGNVLDKPTVAFAQSLNVPVVPSVNAYHYILPHSRSQVKLGNESGGGNSTPESDIRNLRQWGVTCFQIDSVYAPLFEKPL